jgi:predicted  nucleic acid-binding Zn-ribbon protein
MIAGSETLVGLKASKVQLEVALICLRRRQAEMERRRARLADQTDDPVIAARLVVLDRDLEAVDEEVAQGEQAIGEVNDRIDRTSRQTIDEGLEELLVANAGMSEELSALRSEVLDGLRQLAEPLRRYHEVADRKSRLVRKLGNLGKDLSYPNYLDCSLLRQTELDDDLRYLVEAIKHLHVVA